MSNEVKSLIYKILGLVIAIALVAILYQSIQKRSVVVCDVNTYSIMLPNEDSAYDDRHEAAEEIFAKYLEAHNVGGVCPALVISGYQINEVTIRKNSPESFVAHVTFDVSPFDVKNSLWLSEGTEIEDLFVKNIERDFIVKYENDVYSILDVIADEPVFNPKEEN